MSETWIRAGRLGVVVVAVITAAISFTHIRDLALAHGGDSLTSPLLPLGIDGAVAAMTVFMHQARGLALWLARFVLVAAVGMTVACNTAYGAAYGVTGALLWSAPAVLFVGCVEVSVLMVRRTGPVTVAEPDRHAEMAAKKAEVAALRIERATLEAGQVAERVAEAEREAAVDDRLAGLAGLTRGQQAEALGMPQRTLYRKIKRGELPELATVNGKAH